MTYIRIKVQCKQHRPVITQFRTLSLHLQHGTFQPHYDPFVHVRWVLWGRWVGDRFSEALWFLSGIFKWIYSGTRWPVLVLVPEKRLCISVSFFWKYSQRSLSHPFCSTTALKSQELVAGEWPLRIFLARVATYNLTALLNSWSIVQTVSSRNFLNEPPPFFPLYFVATNDRRPIPFMETAVRGHQCTPRVVLLTSPSGPVIKWVNGCSRNNTALCILLGFWPKSSSSSQPFKPSGCIQAKDDTGALPFFSWC